MPQPLQPDLAPTRLIARIITVGSTQFGLLAARPNWDTEIKVSMELPTDVSKEPITFNESRRNFAQTARYHMEWTSYLSSAADSTELRIFLTRIKELPIFVPLWPDVCEVQNALPLGSTNIVLLDLPARWGGFWIITDENFVNWEIITVSTLNSSTRTLHLPTTGVTSAYPAGTLVYPLLLGRLEEQPKPGQITDEINDVAFKIKENSAFSARLIPVSPPHRTLVGPNIPDFQFLPLWDIIPNHSRPTDWTENPDIVYEQIGFLREDQQRVYDHPIPRGQELEFYQADRASIGKAEWFWRERRATTKRFMIPTFRGDLRMMADTPYPGNAKQIVCENSFYSNPGRATQPGDPFVALIDKDDEIDPRELSGTTDHPDQTILLSKTNVSAHTATTTIVSNLLLARFVEPTLEWAYTTPYLATTTIKFVELPSEYGSDINHPTPAELPEPAFLFIFREAGVRTDLFTSYENNIVVPSGTYAGTYRYAPFSFDTVKTGLKLDQEKLEVKSFQFDGNPLNKLWPFALDGILTLEIVEVNLNSEDPTAPPASAVSRFYGDVWSVDSTWKATVIPFGNLFDRQFPRFLLSVPDNYTMFSPPTQTTPTTYAVPGTIHGAVDHTSQTLLVTSTLAQAKITAALSYVQGDGTPLPPDDYFAGGWLTTGTGANMETRGILASVNASGSDVSLTIDRPLIKAANNQAVTLYPGYDGSIGIDEVKFSNRINFGGHPYIPNINPTVKAVKTKNTQGGKKG